MIFIPGIVLLSLFYLTPRFGKRYNNKDDKVINIEYIIKKIDYTLPNGQIDENTFMFLYNRDYNKNNILYSWFNSYQYSTWWRPMGRQGPNRRHITIHRARDLGMFFDWELDDGFPCIGVALW